MKILAFEPYDDGSHRAVRDAISAHSRHEWTWLTRPARAWKWRMRTAAPELMHEAQRRGLLDVNQFPFDAIFMTSLMSAADVRGLLPPSRRDLPVVLYMHENQLAYPDDPALDAQPDAAKRSERDMHFGLTNLTSVLAADMVLWNSRWNLQSFLDGTEELLRHQPDSTLPRGRDLIPLIEPRSAVVWPPVDLTDAQLSRVDHGRVLHNPPVVVWPHRWEHDKGPDRLLELAREWTPRLGIQWILLGQQFRTMPPELAQFCTEFKDSIIHHGFVADREEYLSWLSRADWVLSTARHEFFGIAVAEVMLMGCLPWLPDALSYPELLPDEARDLHPAQPPDDPSALRRAIRSHLDNCLASRSVSLIDELMRSARDYPWDPNFETEDPDEGWIEELLDDA